MAMRLPSRHVETILVTACLLSITRSQSPTQTVTHFRGEDSPWPVSDSACLIQLGLKDSVKDFAQRAEHSLQEPVLSIGQESSSLMFLNTAAMQTWPLLLEKMPKHKKLPPHDILPRYWSGFFSQQRVILLCNIICIAFMCIRAWKQTASRDLKQAYCCSCESDATGHSAIDGQLEMIGPTTSYIVTFNSKEEMLSTFATLPLNRRHISIYLCAMMSYAGSGAVNDTIGLAFGSFEEEWGVQTPNRLACLSLASTAGQILASIFTGGLADSRGRCVITRYASLLVAVSFWFSAMAPSLEMLAVARFFAGLGIGALNVSIPTLLSECLPHDRRCLLVLYQFGWPLGAAGFTFVMSAAGWRAANVEYLPCFSLILAMFWCPGCIPESPKWLCSQEKLQEAADSVYQYGGTSPLDAADTTPATTTEEKDEAQHEVATEEEESNSTQSLYAALGMLCVSIASMLIKVWLPSLLALRGVHSDENAFVTMWLLEASAICVSGVLFGSPSKGTSNDNLVFLRVAQISFLVAALAVFGYLRASSACLITLLGGTHLLGQANASNFLMAFATLSFPVAVRARCIAVMFFAQYVGGFVGPLLGSSLIQFAPQLGASGVLSVAGIIYTFGYISTLYLS